METLFFKLVRVVNLTARPFAQEVGRPLALTLNEWRVMAALGPQGGLTATQLADATGLDKMTVSRALAGLARRKRLQRHDDPTDQRRSRLYLTQAGRRLHDQVQALSRRRESTLFTDLTPAEQERLDRLLDKLIATVSPPAG